jgi:hypothetical protein
VQLSVLLQSFPRLRKLEELHLSLNKITDISVPPLKVFIRLRSLPSLQIWYNSRWTANFRGFAVQPFIADIEKELELVGVTALDL